jgi:hypothetical protein
LYGIIVAENTGLSTYRRVGAMRDSFPFQDDVEITDKVYEVLFSDEAKTEITVV